MNAQWRHNDELRRWELMRDDQIHEPQLAAYVNDEFIAQAAVEIRTLVDTMHPLWPPLPDEATRQSDAT
jgi:hypothetical protein